METASAWVLTGELPSPRYGLRGANIDNRIFMTGKWQQSAELSNISNILLRWILMSWLVWLKQFANKLGGNDGSYSDEILEFDPLTEQWKLVDRMKKARSYHAVSVIEYGEVEQFCNWGVNRYRSHFKFSRDWLYNIYVYVYQLLVIIIRSTSWFNINHTILAEQKLSVSDQSTFLSVLLSWDLNNSFSPLINQVYNP